MAIPVWSITFFISGFEHTVKYDLDHAIKEAIWVLIGLAVVVSADYGTRRYQYLT